MPEFGIGFRYQTPKFYFEIFGATENGEWSVYDSFTGGYPSFTSGELRAQMGMYPNGKCTTATDEVFFCLPNAQLIDGCTIRYPLPGIGNHILVKRVLGSVWEVEYHSNGLVLPGPTFRKEVSLCEALSHWSTDDPPNPA